MKNRLYSVSFLFLLIAGISVSLSSCSNEDASDWLNFPPPPPGIYCVGDSVTTVKDMQGVGWSHTRSIYDNTPYIDTSNGDRYYCLPSWEFGEYGGDFYQEFAIGAMIEFSGVVYKMNEEYIKSQPVLPELAKTIHLYVLAAPNFTIKRISE